MLPWGHLGAGYFVYTIGTRVFLNRSPQRKPVLVLAIGTQFPDLIDKPLNWWFDIFDGRAIGHSLVITVPLCVLLFLVGRRSDRGNLAVGFSIGVITHLLGDAWGSLLTGNFEPIRYLLWPLLSAPTYPSDSFNDHLQQWLFYWDMKRVIPWRSFLVNRFGVQLLFALVAVLVWAADGFPGVRTVLNRIGRLRRDYRSP